MSPRSKRYLAVFAWTVALGLLAGCDMDNTVPPRTPPVGMPGKLIPARPEGHLLPPPKQ